MSSSNPMAPKSHKEIIVQFAGFSLKQPHAPFVLHTHEIVCLSTKFEYVFRKVCPRWNILGIVTTNQAPSKTL